MEKKKLLLVAISVGVFLVLTIGAAILVFTPKNNNLPFETIGNSSNPETISYVTPPSYQSLTTGSEQQPSSIDAVDLVRNPEGVPGLITPPEGNSQSNGAGRSTESVISVTQPTTAAVPSTAPAGRAANQSTTTTPARPAQTTTTPSPTTTSPSQTSSTPARTTNSSSQAATTPAQTTTTPSPNTSTPARTTTAPAQTSATTVQTTMTPAVSTVSQSIPETQTRAYNDYWVQTGAFSTILLAEAVKETLASKGITSIIENANVNGRTLFRVRVGPYTSQNEANYWLALIKSMDGFEDSQVRHTQN